MLSLKCNDCRPLLVCGVDRAVVWRGESIAWLVSFVVNMTQKWVQTKKNKSKPLGEKGKVVNGNKVSLTREPVKVFLQPVVRVYRSRKKVNKYFWNKFVCQAAADYLRRITICCVCQV